MPGIIKLPVGGNGEIVDCIELTFEPRKEPWAEYELTDGGIVRIRATAARIFWQVDSDGKGMRNQDGQPTIIVLHQEQYSANF